MRSEVPTKPCTSSPKSYRFLDRCERAEEVAFEVRRVTVAREEHGLRGRCRARIKPKRAINLGNQTIHLIVGHAVQRTGLATGVRRSQKRKGPHYDQGVSHRTLPQLGMWGPGATRGRTSKLGMSLFRSLPLSSIEFAKFGTGVTEPPLRSKPR